MLGAPHEAGTTISNRLFPKTRRTTGYRFILGLSLGTLVSLPVLLSGQAPAPAPAKAAPASAPAKDQNAGEQPDMSEMRQRMMERMREQGGDFFMGRGERGSRDGRSGEEGSREGSRGGRTSSDDSPTTGPRRGGGGGNEEASKSLKDDDGMVQVNLREAKLDQIVKFISDNTGKAVIIESGLDGSINVVAPKPLPVKEALDLVYQSLLLQQIIVIESGSRIAIVKADKATVIPLPMETGATETGSTLIMKLIPLKHISTEAAVTYVTPLVPDEKAIRPLPEADALLVKATRSDVSRLETMLGEIDKPGTARLEIQIFPLKKASASNISSQLQNLLYAVFSPSDSRRGGGTGGGGGENQQQQGGGEGGRQRSGELTIRVMADEPNRRLILASTPEVLKYAKDLIEQLDQTDVATLSLHQIDLQNADPQQIANLIGQIYRELGATDADRKAVRAFAQGRTLYVVSSKDEFDEVEKLAKKLDSAEPVMEMRVFPLKHGQARDLQQIVQNVLRSGNFTYPIDWMEGEQPSSQPASGPVSRPVAREFDNRGGGMGGPGGIAGMLFGEGRRGDGERGGEGRRGGENGGGGGDGERRGDDGSSEDRGRMMRERFGFGGGDSAQPGQSGPPTDIRAMIMERMMSMGGGGSSRGRQSQQATVVADERMNALVVVAYPEQLAQVEQLLKTIDVPESTDKAVAVRSIDLVYTRASEIQTALQRVFQRLPQENDRDRVEIQATKDEKRLIVLSSEENYKKIVDLLKELDSREEAELTVLELKFADASDLASVLGNMLRSAKTSATARGSNRNATGQVYTVYGESGGLFTTKSDVTIIAESRINALLVAAAPEDLKVIQELVAKLDRPREEQLEMHVVKLNYADATSVADAASQFFQPTSRSPRDEVKILANVYDNSIMAFASAENWQRIQKFIAEMDVADVGKRGTKTYDLKYIDATRLSSQLEELYAEQQPTSYWDIFFGPSQNRRSDAKINFVPSPIGNKLMVVAPPQEIAKIDELVAQLDSPAALEGVRPRIYYIRHTDASQMRDILTELFEGGSSTQNQSGYSFYRPQNQRTGTANSSLGDVSFVVDRDANALIAFSSNPANLDLVDQLINQLDIMAPESTNTETIQLEYADAYNMSILLNSLYGGTQPRQQSQGGGSQQPQQNSGQDGTYSSLVPTRTLVERPDYGDMYFWWQSTNERQNEEARPISTLIEQVRIVPDLRTNSLLLTAAPHHLEPLKALIAYLDRPEPQVVIKTRIVEIVQRGEKRTGVRWTPDPSTIRPEELDNAVSVLGSLNLIDTFGEKVPSIDTENGPSINNNTINRGFNDAGQHIIGSDVNLTLLVQLLLKNTDSRELSKPTLTVDNNEIGTIFVGSDVPFITNSQINTNGARNDSYEYREVGTRLDITPHINSKGQVVLEIDLGSSAIREGEQLFGGAILDRRSYSTQIALEDGQTLVLGGILGETEKETLRKTPILGDIPIIKHAFRKTERSNETRELLAFVSPQVLWNRDDADQATQQIIGQTNSDNSDFYPTIDPPTKDQREDMLKQDKRRREAAAARALDREQSWEYSLQKIRRDMSADQLNRAYQILQFDDPATAPAAIAEKPAAVEGKIPPPPVFEQKVEQVGPSVWKVDPEEKPAAQPATSSEADVLRARLNEFLEQRQMQQPETKLPPLPAPIDKPVKPSATPGAELQFMEAVEKKKEAQS